MTYRDRTIVRILGIALLLLALSPVTAPFATCDLIDLFGGATTPVGTTIGSKASPHEPVSDLGRESRVPLVFAGSATLLLACPRSQAALIPLDLPLRI